MRNHLLKIENPKIKIKFNLLALVPDKISKYQQEKTLNENKKAYIYRKLNKQQENSSEDKEVNTKNMIANTKITLPFTYTPKFTIMIGIAKFPL